MERDKEIVQSAPSICLLIKKSFTMILVIDLMIILLTSVKKTYIKTIPVSDITYMTTVKKTIPIVNCLHNYIFINKLILYVRSYTHQLASIHFQFLLSSLTW